MMMKNITTYRQILKYNIIQSDNDKFFNIFYEYSMQLITFQTRIWTKYLGEGTRHLRDLLITQADCRTNLGNPYSR
jgi:hypothetical protein